jgi:hypothetical protein
VANQPNVIGYNQLLSLVDNFMKQSGISELCQQQCHGACCHFPKTGRCDHIAQNCEKNPRLACRVWLCQPLLDSLCYLAKLQNKTAASEFLTFYIYRFKPDIIKKLYRLTNTYEDRYERVACYDHLPVQSIIDNFKIEPFAELTSKIVIEETRELIGLINKNIRSNSYFIELIKKEEPITNTILRIIFS